MMQMLPVTTRSDEKRFIGLAVSLYRNHPSWIRPLDADLRAVFDPESNRAFDHGDCQRWLLEDNGRVVGRIAAFVTRRDAAGGEQAAGGIGFFECVEDRECARLMFDTARDWLASRGATYMDGPINFGRRDKWWGLLTKGFDLEPNYQCNYHFPYYRDLFESYGFQNYYEQYSFIRRLDEPLSEKLAIKAEKIAADPSYTFRHLRLAEYDRYVSDIIAVYNKAWVKHEGVDTLSPEQGKAIMNQIRPIIDEYVIWIAYYNGEPVAIFVCIPEVNQVLKHVGGRLDLAGKLKFFWLKRSGRMKKLLGMVFGVVPEHQGKGVDGAIIHTMNRVLLSQRSYESFEMTGIGDFNPKMILVVRQVGGRLSKVHTTYRYLFDRSQPFQRMKAIK